MLLQARTTHSELYRKGERSEVKPMIMSALAGFRAYDHLPTVGAVCYPTPLVRCCPGIEYAAISLPSTM